MPRVLGGRRPRVPDVQRDDVIVPVFSSPLGEVRVRGGHRRAAARLDDSLDERAAQIGEQGGRDAPAVVQENRLLLVRRGPVGLVAVAPQYLECAAVLDREGRPLHVLGLEAEDPQGAAVADDLVPAAVLDVYLPGEDARPGPAEVVPGGVVVDVLQIERDRQALGVGNAAARAALDHVALGRDPDRHVRVLEQNGGGGRLGDDERTAPHTRR